MLAKMIPLIMVKDVKINVEYLIKTLGFHLDWVDDAGNSAVMNCCGALLMLQSSNRDASLDGGRVQHHVEILIRIQGGVDEIYGRAFSRGAIISRHLNSVMESQGLVIRRFSVSLPDGYSVTFFEYVSSIENLTQGAGGG